MTNRRKERAGDRPLVLAATASLALLLMVPLSTSHAHADDGDQTTTAPTVRDRPSPRFGGWLLSFGNEAIDSAYVCGEYYPTARWSVVGCGAGAGFLYEQRPGQRDMAHFRLQYALPLRGALWRNVELSPGLGIVELQRGRDESGFKFAPGRGPDVREASGTEAALELELAPDLRSKPFRTLRITGTGGVAWIPDAPAVVPSAREVSGFFYLTFNGTY